MLRFLEVSTEEISEGNIEGLFLGTWLGSLGVIKLVTYDSNALLLWYGKQLGTTLGPLDGSPLGTYDSTDLGLS